MTNRYLWEPAAIMLGALLVALVSAEVPSKSTSPTNSLSSSVSETRPVHSFGIKRAAPDCTEGQIEEGQLTITDCNFNGIDDAIELTTPRVALEARPGFQDGPEHWDFEGGNDWDYYCPGTGTCYFNPERGVTYTSKPIDLLAAGAVRVSYDYWTRFSQLNVIHPNLEVFYWDGSNWILARVERPLFNEVIPISTRVIRLPRRAIRSDTRIRFHMPFSYRSETWLLNDIRLSVVESDCDESGVLDSCEVSAGTVDDCNGNGVPDLCEFNLPQFDHADEYDVGKSPFAAAAGDFDGDGLLDLLVTQGWRTTEPSIELLLNDGAQFHPPVQAAFAGNEARSIVVADFDQNGLDDFVFVSVGVGVYLNAGGTWYGLRMSEGYSPPATANAVTAGDFDKDGDVDVAVAIGAYFGSAGSVVFLVNNGGGSFEPLGSFPTGALPRSITTLDANQDGLLDLAVGNQGASTVSVGLNLGFDEEGEWLGFEGTKEFSTEHQPFSIASADFNHDGFDDLVVAELVSDSAFTYLLNLGKSDSGSWLGYGSYVLVSGLGDGVVVAVGDLNNDGWADVASASNKEPAYLNIYYNQGKNLSGNWLGFGDHRTEPIEPIGRSILMADFDDDGMLEIVTVSRAFDGVYGVFGVPRVKVFRQYGELGTDCNANGVPDDCDAISLPGGDSDGNNVPDECQPDCNGDGVLDSFELAAGAMDCNQNSIPDSCDITGGISEDCNTNGILDECETKRIMEFESAFLQPLKNGIEHHYVVPSKRLAHGDVQLTVITNGDHQARTEYVDVFLNDTLLARLYDIERALCARDPSVARLSIPVDQYNAALAEGEAILKVISSAPGECNGDRDSKSFAILVVRFEAEGEEDCNQNLKPDSCEILIPGNDCSGNSILDQCEIAMNYVYGDLKLTDDQDELEYVLGDVPRAQGPVTIRVTARTGLLSSQVEMGYLDLFLNDVGIGSVFRHYGHWSPQHPDKEEITIDAARFNRLSADAGNVVKILPRKAASLSSVIRDGFVALEVEYRAIDPQRDCNLTGVPDNCERAGDGDGDGVLDRKDVLILIENMTGPTPPTFPRMCRPFDINNNGTIDFRDYAELITQLDSLP